MTAGAQAQVPMPHKPVMLAEVLTALAPKDGGIYVDATFGAGGYSHALLDAAQCTVWGIDRDPDALPRAQALASRYPGRLSFLPGRFGDLDALLSAAGVAQIDGVAFDLGVSSMQIDSPDRGFSFRFDGPLDMRMEQGGPTAADIVNAAPEADLADILYIYGEERASRRIAHAIIEARAEGPIERTGQLADVVRGVMRRAKDGIDPATRTFQALRIYVNDELADLDRGLMAAERLLAPGGRLAVVAFHSLEDRRVKTFLQSRSGRLAHGSRHLPPTPEPAFEPTFHLLRRGTLKPSAAESKTNPRARSARLRAAERTAATPWPIPDDFTGFGPGIGQWAA
jgi:16S rRNA (cytosine1402-N4)-methyltransferase